MSIIMYHHHRPTIVQDIQDSVDKSPKIAVQKNITSRKILGFDVAPEGDYIQSRNTLIANNDFHIGVAAPRKSFRDYFYKNAYADEMLFIHRGSGTLRTFL